MLLTRCELLVGKEGLGLCDHYPPVGEDTKRPLHLVRLVLLVHEEIELFLLLLVVLQWGRDLLGYDGVV